MNTIESIIRKFRSENPSKIYTCVEIHEILFGKDSCFLVSKSYRSMYNDDYASFAYYSNETGEYFDDEWTTAFACPRYDSYLCKKFEDAEKENLIDVKLFNKNFKYSVDFIKNPKINADYICYWEHPEVIVTRGRKVKKGTKGIFVKTISKPSYIGGELTAAIIKTEDGEFVEVNPNYLQITEECINNIYNFVKEALDKEMEVTDRIRKFNAYAKVKDYWMSKESEFANLESEYAIEVEKQDRVKYYPSEKFIVWLKEHFPNYSEEEIIEKGIAINKKNSNK